MWWGFFFPKYPLSLGKTLMEISHASLETSVASIGINGLAEEVTVSTDAEFMMMIAHGIYSNKALALIRELLCNARDGHAKAGCLDKPIHITLTDNLLVVRDYGTGIPNAIFAKTYMTFGQSTKRKDKAATGGFGVGTKVPWAVCDTFSARNWIDRTMTAYSIVKSDPNMEGKPTCTPVMTIPSIEPSGVEVSVPFPEKMHHEIKNNLRWFVEELNIPAIINGVEHVSTRAPIINELYNTGFFYTEEHPKTVIQTSFFYVRQGDVLYPVEVQDEFAESATMLKAIANNKHGCYVFLAEPDSIIPTLSRESLQYTERTCMSIKLLMDKVLQELADQLDEYQEKTEKFLPDYLKNSPYFTLNMWNYTHSLVPRFLECHQKYLMNASLSPTQNYLLKNNMSRWLGAKLPYLESKKITGKNFREKIEHITHTMFLEGLTKYTHLDQDRLIEVWKEKPNSYQKSKEFKQNTTRNFYEEIMLWRSEIEFNPDIVEVYIPNSTNFIDANSSSKVSRVFTEVSLIKGLDKTKENFSHNWDLSLESVYVSKTVVISTTIPVMLARAREWFYKNQSPRSPMLDVPLGHLLGARCVRVKASIKPTEIKQLKSLFQNWGYDVLVLMDPSEGELEERKLLAEERAKLKQKKLLFLHEFIPHYSNNPKEARKLKKSLYGLASNPEYKGEPLYLNLRSQNDIVPYEIRGIENYFEFVKFLGTDIVCVSNKTELNRAIKEGRRNIEEAFLEFTKWFFTQPDIHRKLFFDQTIFSIRARQNKYLTKYLFNFVPETMTTEQDRILKGILKFSNIFTSTRMYVRSKTTYYNRCCSSEDHYLRLFEAYAQSHFCDVNRAFDVAYQSQPSPQRALARSILKKLLKGSV